VRPPVTQGVGAIRAFSTTIVAEYVRNSRRTLGAVRDQASDFGRCVAKAPATCSLPVVNLKWRLSHVRGYLELGMVKHARAELAAIPAEDAQRPEVIALRVAMLQATEQWRPLRKLAGELAAAQPTEANWWVIWAYAARRASSVKAADKILRQAEEHHPDDATIQFNLGCYACLLGDLAGAKARLVRAIALDSDYLKNACDDPDLQALRDAEPDWMNQEQTK
jgi:tetratricopeptide (TPR) repeat protein